MSKTMETGKNVWLRKFTGSALTPKILWKLIFLFVFFFYNGIWNLTLMWLFTTLFLFMPLVVFYDLLRNILRASTERTGSDYRTEEVKAVLLAIKKSVALGLENIILEFDSWK